MGNDERSPLETHRRLCFLWRGFGGCLWLYSIWVVVMHQCQTLEIESMLKKVLEHCATRTIDVDDAWYPVLCHLVFTPIWQVAFRHFDWLMWCWDEIVDAYVDVWCERWAALDAGNAWVDPRCSWMKEFTKLEGKLMGKHTKISNTLEYNLRHKSQFSNPIQR